MNVDNSTLDYISIYCGNNLSGIDTFLHRQYRVPGRMGHGEEGSCAPRSVLKFKLKIPDHKIISEKRKAGRGAPSNFRAIWWWAPDLPFPCFPSSESLFWILLENNDLCRRRPYGRARDGLLSRKDEVHKRNSGLTLTYPRYRRTFLPLFRMMDRRVSGSSMTKPGRR